jgi:hypothetical protein
LPGGVLQLRKEGKRDSQEQEEATKDDEAMMTLVGQRAAQAVHLWDAAGRGGIATAFLYEILETERKIQFLPVVQRTLSFQTNAPENGNSSAIRGRAQVFLVQKPECEGG